MGRMAPVISAVVVFLFLAGLWFTVAIVNGPNFHPKLTLGGLLTVRPARQEAGLLRRMTTTALGVMGAHLTYVHA